MKKIFYTILFFQFLISNQLSSQFSFDVASGINYTNASHSQKELFELEPLFGYFLGVAPKKTFDNRVSFAINLQYNYRGYTDNYAKSQNLDYQYSFIDLSPELSKESFGMLFYGFGFNFSRKIKHSDLDWLEKYDFGPTGHLGISHKGFFMVIRYFHGVYNNSNFLFTDENGNSVANIVTRTRSVQIGVGYTFNKK